MVYTVKRDSRLLGADRVSQEGDTGARMWVSCQDDRRLEVWDAGVRVGGVKLPAHTGQIVFKTTSGAAGVVVPGENLGWVIPPIEWFNLAASSEPLVFSAPQFVSGGQSQWNNINPVNGVRIAEGANWGSTSSHGVPNAGDELVPGLKGCKTIGSTVYLQIYLSRLANMVPYSIGCNNTGVSSFTWSSPVALPNGGFVSSVNNSSEKNLSLFLVRKNSGVIQYALPDRS